jgi:hypothetical protein
LHWTTLTSATKDDEFFVGGADGSMVQTAGRFNGEGTHWPDPSFAAT